MSVATRIAPSCSQLAQGPPSGSRGRRTDSSQSRVRRSAASPQCCPGHGRALLRLRRGLGSLGGARALSTRALSPPSERGHVNLHRRAAPTTSKSRSHAPGLSGSTRARAVVVRLSGRIPGCLGQNGISHSVLLWIRPERGVAGRWTANRCMTFSGYAIKCVRCASKRTFRKV